MQENLNVSNTTNTNSSSDSINIVQTDVGAKDGQVKCPKCGSTDISTNTENGKLRCNFCRHEFEHEKIQGMIDDIAKLEGQVIGSGAQNIVEGTNDIITLKCSSCGAEVVIDTSSVSQARCHWCRNTLSINQQIPNGSIPDVVLPFNISKDTARLEIENFVGKRKFFAHPKFKKEFTTENIMGVYFPYMIIDVNAHALLTGEGEHEIRSYHVKVGDRQETRYDAALYHVEREFDILIHGLSIESSSRRLDNKSKNETNNIINSIMPFDVENCVKYNANYLKGYTSEKRDVNIDQLKEIVGIQSKDISRFSANDTLKTYDRGVAWSNEQLDVKGQQWKAAYLPVWLYSYQQIKNGKSILHYVAVNARTKETMGSVPIHYPKLLLISFIIELLAIFLIYRIEFEYEGVFLLSGIVYYLIMYARYRNSNARHTYERETKTDVSNLRKVDTYLKEKKGLTNSMMEGANNRSVYGQAVSNKLLDSISNKYLNNDIVDLISNNNSDTNENK